MDEPYTVDTKISEVISDPVLGEYGRLIFPVDRGYCSGDTLGDLRLAWYSDTDPDKTVEIANYLRARAAAGQTVFYDIYTDEEKADDPAKEDTGLFFFKGKAGAPFAVCNAGGGFAYVGAMQDSFPHALELSKKGYNAFTLIYRPGAQTACEDIHEIHMEEDAGKLIHDEWEDCTIVDYNRCGVPLIEIVSEPDMRSADEVIAYLEKLRMILQYLGVSDCKMQEGSLRADINLSVREAGSDKLGTRTEMKNMNSFKAIARAIEGEMNRQIELLEDGKSVTQETRRWDDNKCASYAMRSKEDAQDYRYFPDPDLPPVSISDAWLERVKAAQPEMRDAKLARYVEEYGLTEHDAAILTESRKMADIFEAAAAICKKPKEVSNWLIVDTMRLLKVHEMDAADLKFSPDHLAKLIELIDAGTINRPTARDVFEKVFAENVDPEAYVEANGLKIEADDGALKGVIEGIVAANPQSVADYHAGKKKAIGFLVGQTMKAMKGKADPGTVNKILAEILNQ